MSSELVALRRGGSNIALGLRKRILVIKKEGGSRWGRGLGVGGEGRRRVSRLPATHFLLPSILRDGAIYIDDALRFLDESFQQRRQDNINALLASLMAN